MRLVQIGLSFASVALFCLGFSLLLPEVVDVIVTTP